MRPSRAAPAAATGPPARRVAQHAAATSEARARRAATGGADPSLGMPSTLAQRETSGWLQARQRSAELQAPSLSAAGSPPRAPSRILNQSSTIRMVNLTMNYICAFARTSTASSRKRKNAAACRPARRSPRSSPPTDRSARRTGSGLSSSAGLSRRNNFHCSLM